MTRVAIYARYSSDQQRDTSIEDQVRLCRERAEREGWEVYQVYTDHAISGASLMRPGIQMVMQDAGEGRFDIVVAEALDRLSRDQEDTAGLYKRLQFAGVKILTLSEGEVTSLHIGLKGTMNAMFLQDLAIKTRRGLRGRVEKGRSGGGIVYGYDVVTRIADHGAVERGERKINEFEAAVVRRIFEDYVKGISPRTIAKALNAEGISAPTGGDWGASTIYGNRARGTGILNNELYIGKLVWNRLRYIKDPETGKRVSRQNPEDQWIITDVPDLRIVSDELWQSAKKVQGEYAKREKPDGKHKRPQYLLSHLVKCGCCGGGYAMAGRKRMACSTVRNKGTCSNKLTIEREKLETAVLGALQTHLMDSDLTAQFCDEYTKRLNELRQEYNQARQGVERELAQLEKERLQIVESICNGVPAELVRDRAVYVNERKKKLTEILADTKEQQVAFHPAMAGRYHKEIRNLIESWNVPEHRPQAAKLLRSLIDRVVLTPNETGDELVVDLIGDLAGILSVATKQDRTSITSELSKLQPVHKEAETAEIRDSEDGGGATSGRQFPMVAGKRSTQQLSPAPEGPGSYDQRQFAVVAGAGFEPATFRL